jgi:hypothetical protein
MGHPLKLSTENLIKIARNGEAFDPTVFLAYHRQSFEILILLVAQLGNKEKR